MTPRQYWQKLAARIDRLSLRERVLMFAAAAVVMLFVAYLAVLGPLLARQAALRTQVGQQQNNIKGMEAEIAQKIQAYQRDPDAATRDRLRAVISESAQLGDSLRTMQKGLVAPERMAPLIETILRANGRLKLLSMRTLPVSSLNEPPASELAAAPGKDDKPDAKAGTDSKMVAIKSALLAPAAPSAAAAVTPKAGSLLYRHGVEITVRGNYLDMIDYMNSLEMLPTQLFWGGAHLEVEEYPTSRLTLTLYTLSLDSKWLKL